ncbi:hypothetical protein [uncultured Jannaschia sp.]|uniref:hypothetical protein n=1 Tax=uncultured Jannaschia sp. TaxID=293347 RepID=UPI00262B515C|nr:hypothetical protein [uncultured Jannaschia sp.]
MYRLILIALLALGHASAGAEEAARAPLAPALRAEIALSRPDGQPLVDPAPGAPFAVEIALRNMAGRDAPRGLDLVAWLRRTEGGGITCTEAARAYFATERSLPIGTVPLGGSLLAVLTGEGSIALVDPNFQLATANILAAVSIPEQVDRLVPDPFLRRVLAVSQDSGTVRAVSIAGGAAEVLVADLRGLEAVYPGPDGQIWVRTRDGFGPPAEVVVPATGSAASYGGIHVAIWTGREAEVIDLRTGTSLGVSRAGIQAAIPLEAADGELSGLVALTHEGIAVHWADAPEQPVQVDLPPGFSRLDVDPSGRFAFAHGPDVGDVAIVDLARGALVQIVVSNPPVSEIAFTSRDAFLRASDHSRVAVLSLGAIRPDQPPLIQEATLGTAAASRTAPGLLTAMEIEDRMIAVHPDSYTAYALHGSATTGKAPPMLSGAPRGALPPMFSITLRGGIPRQVVSIDRGFREVVPGRFRTVTALPDDHAYELVGSTGLGGMSFCAPIAKGRRAPPPPEGRLSLVRIEGDDHLRFADTNGQPIPFDGDVLLLALQGGWRRAIPVAAGPDGLSRETVDIPATLPLALMARSGDGRAFPILQIGARR